MLSPFIVECGSLLSCWGGFASYPARKSRATQHTTWHHTVVRVLLNSRRPSDCNCLSAGGFNKELQSVLYVLAESFASLWFISAEPKTKKVWTSSQLEDWEHLLCFCRWICLSTKGVCLSTKGVKGAIFGLVTFQTAALLQAAPSPELHSELHGPAHTNLDTSSTFFFVGLLKDENISLNTSCWLDCLH